MPLRSGSSRWRKPKYKEAQAKGVDGAKVMADFRAEIKKVATEKR